MPMYNLIEYSPDYSKTVGSLWFCFKETNFNTGITNNDNFKSFKYKGNY